MNPFRTGKSPYRFLRGTRISKHMDRLSLLRLKRMEVREKELCTVECKCCNCEKIRDYENQLSQSRIL